MKILHIIDSGGLYGAEMVLLNLVAEQIKQGLEPIIASIGEKGVEEKPLNAYYFLFFCLPNPACPACPVAPADGTGVAPADGTGVGNPLILSEALIF